LLGFPLQPFERDQRRPVAGVRLSDLEMRFSCQACGRRGADVRPNFGWEREAGQQQPVAPWMPDTGWRRYFDDPIPLPRGRQLVTLADAGNYIMKLPKGEHETAQWQAVMEALILVATSGGPTMLGLCGLTARRLAITRGDQFFLELRPFVGRHGRLLGLRRQIFYREINACFRKRRCLGPRVHQ
jgi:hypothetical protein